MSFRAKSFIWLGVLMPTDLPLASWLQTQHEEYE